MFYFVHIFAFVVESDVVCHRFGEQEHVLRHKRSRSSHVVQFIFGNVLTVHGYTARSTVVKTVHKAHNNRFSAARSAHYSHFFTVRQIDVNAF